MTSTANSTTSKTVETTATVVASMMKERVGTSILDSGGTPKYDENGNYIGSSNGSGRGFERNQRRSFENEPNHSLRVTKHGIEYSRNLYHFLVNNLKFDTKLDEQFREYVETQDPHDGWMVLMDGFVEHLQETGHTVTGLYGDGDSFTVNTYNHESALSQTIQYVYFTLDSEKTCVLLQVHNGADVRGGYTAPRAFEVLEEGFLMDTDGDVRCDNDECEASWYTQDGGSSWTSNSDDVNLEDFDRVEAGEQDDGEVVTAGDVVNIGRIVYGDGEPTCPCCGTGRLS